MDEWRIRGEERSELTKDIEGWGEFARACCCYDGSDQDKSGRFRTSADAEGVPPARFPRLQSLHHQIRSSSNDGQGEGNHRRHRVRTNRNPPRHTFTFFSPLEAQLAPARQPWQSICGSSCPVAPSSTRTYVQEQFTVHLAHHLTFVGSLGFCSGQHRFLHLSWGGSDSELNSRKNLFRYTRCTESRTGTRRRDVYSGTGWFPS